VGRWVSADPALVEGKYFPKPNDFDTEHDFYWYLQQDGSKKLPGIGGVFNAVNLDVYHYAGQNPVKLVDPDGEITIVFEINSNDPYGAIAFQIGEPGARFNYFSKWVTRGVSQSGNEVAIKSGIYEYEIDYFKIFEIDTPRLYGTLNNHPTKGKIGGRIPTIGPNYGNPKNSADGIRIHKMREKPITSKKHGNKIYVGSEGCNGPAGEREFKKYMGEKSKGYKGTYVLIRLKEIFGRFLK
jgi:hypothetical protein